MHEETPSDKMFSDIRVFDPNCKSCHDIEPSKVYEQHEKEKKSETLYRARKVDPWPYSFSTSGGWGMEASKFHKHLARLMAEKRDER